MIPPTASQPLPGGRAKLAGSLAWAILLAGCFLLWPLLWWTAAEAAGTPAGSPAYTAYLEGLDALNQGKYNDATAAFSRALEISGDDPTFVLARGVSETLAEQFPQALTDLARAKRLGLRGREAELWTYAAEAMSGIVSPEHTLGGGRRRGNEPAVVSVPGHVAQGRDDYSTEYGSFIVYQLGMAYQKYRLPRDGGGLGNPAGVKGPEMRQAMLQAGQMFAERWLKRPELATASAARAKQGLAGGDYGVTLREAERARASRPGDPDVRFAAAESWLALGRPVTARAEYTIALTAKTDFAAAYAGRAMAAARVGDAKRARADLDIAARLDSGVAGKARPAVESELGRQRVDGSADKLLGDLEQAARSGAPMDQLIPLATKVHKAAGEQRLRYDEIYQDRLRVLEDAVRANPRSADRLADLSKYLVDESDNRGEKVEPRRELIFYRWQESREKELGRAIQIADRALALDGRHVAATMQKARALTALKQYDQAEALADQVLKLAGSNPDALRLYARFRAARANQMSAEAAGLRQERCTSSTHDETRSDGVYRVTRTTCYPPTQADLQRAAQLDAQAADLRRRARAAMEAAIKATKGTVEGFLIQADLHLWDNQLDAAQAALQAAVKLDPKSLEAQEELAQFYARTGQTDRAEEQWAIARQLIHTTAAPMLRLAWGRANKTAWQGAQAALGAARRLDPEDARTPAYLGVVLEGDGKPKDAAGAFRTALALEEARLRLDEPAASPKPLTRDAIDFGLPIIMMFRLAGPLEQAGNHAEVLALYEGAAAYQPRMTRGWESRQMFTAMLPDQAPDRGAVVPAPPNAATMIADAHLRAGKVLAAMGRRDDAIRHFTSAASLGPRRMAGIPQIGNSRGDTNFSGIAKGPAAEASLYLAQALLAKGDAQGAQQALYEVGRDIPEHLRKDLNELNMAIARQSSVQQPPSSGGMDPQRQQMLRRPAPAGRGPDAFGDEANGALRAGRTGGGRRLGDDTGQQIPSLAEDLDRRRQRELHAGVEGRRQGDAWEDERADAAQRARRPAGACARADDALRRDRGPGPHDVVRVRGPGRDADHRSRRDQVRGAPAAVSPGGRSLRSVTAEAGACGATPTFTRRL